MLFIAWSRLSSPFCSSYIRKPSPLPAAVPLPKKCRHLAPFFGSPFKNICPCLVLLNYVSKLLSVCVWYLMLAHFVTLFAIWKNLFFSYSFSFQFSNIIIETLRPHGGDKESRTLDPLLARQVLSQLSYTPIFVVGWSGLEPPTSRLSGVCSNQLSYQPSSKLVFSLNLLL